MVLWRSFGFVSFLFRPGEAASGFLLSSEVIAISLRLQFSLFYCTHQEKDCVKDAKGSTQIADCVSVRIDVFFTWCVDPGIERICKLQISVGSDLSPECLCARL